MTEFPGFNDCRGIRIKVGDIIVYPVRRRGDMQLKEATVCEVVGKGCTIKKGVVALNTRGRRVIIQTPERCAVVSNYIERNQGR